MQYIIKVHRNKLFVEKRFVNFQKDGVLLKTPQALKQVEIDIKWPNQVVHWTVFSFYLCFCFQRISSRSLQMPCHKQRGFSANKQTNNRNKQTWMRENERKTLFTQQVHVKSWKKKAYAFKKYEVFSLLIPIAQDGFNFHFLFCFVHCWPWVLVTLITQLFLLHIRVPSLLNVLFMKKVSALKLRIVCSLNETH